MTPEQLNELPNGIIRARIAATVGRTADPEPSGLEPLAPHITMHFLYRIREGLAHLLQAQRSGWSLAESIARLVADVTGAHHVASHTGPARAEMPSGLAIIWCVISQDGGLRGGRYYNNIKAHSEISDCIAWSR